MLTIKNPVESLVIEILGHMKMATDSLDVQYFMIGAKAIDLWLYNIHGFPSQRPTRDTDFAVALKSWEQFDELKSSLIRYRQFQAGRQNTSIKISGLGPD